MISLGLSAADRAAFEAALAQSHRIRVRARIHDHDEKIIHEFSGSILSGAVQVDASGTGPLGFDPKDSPIRTLDLTVLLPRKDASWLPDAPGDESVFANNYVSVLYGVWVDGLSTPRLGNVATAAGASISDHLVATDADATDIAIGDMVRLHHASGAAIDGIAHQVVFTDSAFGFTNLHLSPAASSGFMTGDFAQVTTAADWVDVPVFWGPITTLERDGDQVSIGGSGKEVLGLAPAMLWNPLTLRKGTVRTTAIRRVLQAIGEARFDLPELANRISNTWSLDRHAEPWKYAVRLAKYADRQLFYDGLGRAKMRRYPQNRAWLFRGGPGGTLLSKPKISYDIADARNTVEVLGGTPKGKKKKIRATAQPNPSNPLSAWTLRRNGKRRYLVEVVENDVTKQSTATHIADRTLDGLLTATVSFEFETLPIPHLEEGDRVAVLVSDTYATGPARLLVGSHYEFSLQRFTLPLTSGESMSIGVNRRVSWRRRRSGHINRWGD